jgi:hypothetical protein
VYRLFFISKAPSFYIIRSSLVSIGGVYGEQVTPIHNLHNCHRRNSRHMRSWA